MPKNRTESSHTFLQEKEFLFLKPVRKKYFTNQEKIWSARYKKPCKSTRKISTTVFSKFGKNTNSE
jgi:hypothetical protein